ncbi:GldM family protein [Flavobacterium yafengii]|uniref:type IX secretion system motor protein PorM/GldM n=1 Tax=Flavobacterium yafengii TaxID=3041253 RepID=UPI0024A9C42C|nr:GldM family protein [Flavobacterium yafengii]MDI5899075.1 GldM family protein [Flavobacterium yafengii]
MEATLVIKNILLPKLEKDPQFSEKKVDSFIWEKLVYDILHFEEDAKPLYASIYSLELDNPEKIINKLPNIYSQFLKVLAENYDLGQTSDATNYLLETNNVVFLKEVQFLQTMQQAIKSVERKRIKAHLPKSYERLTFELSETEIVNATKQKGREDLRVKMQQWNKELEGTDIVHSEKNDSGTSDQMTPSNNCEVDIKSILKDPKIISLSWLKHFIAVCIILSLSIYNFKLLTTNDNFIPPVKEKSVGIAVKNNYQTIVVLDRNTYFQGEKVTGKVVLGKINSNILFTDLIGPVKIENGEVVISLIAGEIGEPKINGQFNIMVAGKEIPLKFSGRYIVVPRPNSAIISADKMNVVYRGIVNPISVSFEGIDPSKVVASAPGLTYAGKPGRYNMIPQSGSEVVINVTGTLPSGNKVTDKKIFRIVGIPNPSGTLRGEMGIVKGPKSNLEILTIGAILPDFDFEVGLNIIGFNFKVVGYPTIVVQGNKLNAQCKSVLSKLRSGDQIIISEIKIKLVDTDILLPRTAPVIYEIQ